MSKLKVNQIKQALKQKFEANLDLSDLRISDSEREHKILTRCLAALAVYLQTGCTEEEAAKAVWDGPDDDGIDGAYFDTSDSCVVFVQSKWMSKGSGEPEAKDLGAFVKGVKDAIEQDQVNFHARLHGRLSNITLALEKPGTSVHLVVISTGTSQLARHGQAVIDSTLKDINGDDPEPIASFTLLGLAEVYSGLVNDPRQGNILLQANIVDWSFVASPHQAYFGVIDGLQLKEWWAKYGKRLISKNIRHSLGSTEVNTQIKTTAATDPERFWYFNNGITLITDEATKAPIAAASRSSGVFLFKGASIVNGAQTVSSLAKVESDESLGRVRVAIRVIVLKDTPTTFGSDVARTNNLQNRIESRDFVSQDVEQLRLRQEMAIEGVDYQFVRSEETKASDNSCELIEATTALACADGDPNLAVQVKNGIGRFYADLSKAPYKTLFNPSVSGAGVFNTVIVYRHIEDWIGRKKQEFKKKSGTGWGVLVHGNRILSAAVFRRFDNTRLSKPIADFRDSLNRPALDELCENAYSKAVDAIQKNFEGKFLAVLFKNQTISKQVFELISK